MLRYLALAIILLAPAQAQAQAGKYNPKLAPGSPAPAWKALPGIDGKNHSLDDLKDKDVVVVAFLCCSCPAVEDYEDRLIALAKKHGGPKGKVGVVAINVNTIDEDRPPAMKKRAEAKGYPFPYLYDETQKIARDFGAAYTPEFFVLDKARKVVYLGAFDDDEAPAKVKARFVEDAVAAAIAGKAPAVGETLGRGCRIRYDRKKKASTQVTGDNRAKETENVLSVMLDGLRWQEVFTGADEALMNKAHGGVANVGGPGATRRGRGATTGRR
jgi:thiol-disulfide isomerase/thioredoxin